MKGIVKYISGVFFLIGMIACSKEKIIAPVFDIEVNATKISVGEPLVITIHGSAETFSIFTGDAGHEYNKSHLFINAGQDTDYEDVWLPAKNISLVMAHIEPSITAHNTRALTDQSLAIINVDSIRAAITRIADIHYSNSELLRVRIFDIILELTDVKALSEAIVNSYSENNNKLYAPPGGYSAGFPVDRIEKSYVHTYSQAGTYTLTVVGTNVSNKLYTGDGYNSNRVSSGNEYRYKRTIREVVITVE